MAKKIALITGVTGQDGAYLSRFLLGKGYEVHGLRRRASLPNLDRVHDLVQPPQGTKNNFYLHYGDMSDPLSLVRLLADIEPTEVYNLAAQSHVHVSFNAPENTADVNAIGTLRLLDAIRTLKQADKVKFYQASTSELYGKIQEPRQSETTPFYPRSPYATAKLYAYWSVVNYRESYGMFACNGILFNHESKLRGKTFVTRKITSAIARMIYGLQDCLYLGNLDAQRDWGHAKDYVEAQWLMLQQDKPEDYVIASGSKTSVRQFVELSFAELGITLAWQGSGVDEIARIDTIDKEKTETLLGSFISSLNVGDVVVKIDPFYFRPNEVDVLWGDASKAERELGWKPKVTLNEMVNEMMTHDLSLSRDEAILNKYSNE
ncbi:MULTISPECIES: GDP-mannose 4,6-dehydratase [Alteromonas]|jgi:GDPmannose 4,6-dehydratase|uniref:GDP-mannose 4,6-dehydratase n=1 Tax=Alteromonas stellipolaris TaxID=233316 RepID=A0AAW7Z6H3_9ALTE|nr:MULTISPECIES: GDP-mannose 4,6-dehydratase [Alteromonas]AMJ90755.1 GDP-mannose 4,6 dehydratase [Alteromonas sp. Mac2]AMJ86896.1 GDP-mannose 4,6 dehydratase [Alteromonas sp. Mac1]ANB23297.1 GDP-mannose 4,6-dehydratase [Alteromonas stellipolaris]MBZ2163861.1 GDP-mannose 4,6-dehydratase [Alteromonas stellipolaris]MDO6579108.1 GDP-mannose 4,6-dehydratase [Alteromonas stellipolaris]